MRKYLLSVGIFFALFSAIFLVYSPNWRGVFVADDYVWIEPINWSQIKRDFSGTWGHGNTLRPIMRLQFFSSRILFGENPIGWRLTNYFLHATVAFVLYFILKKITDNTLLAFFTALFFAIFPGNHEAVAWVSGRTHPFGFLLSILAFYLIYRSFTSSKYSAFQIVSGYVVLLSAFLTYEVSFVVPLSLLLALFIFSLFSKRNFAIVGGTFALLLALIIYRWQVLGGSIGSVGQHQSNILLAPFLNFHQLETLYFYSRPLKFIIFFFCALLGYLLYKNKVWRSKSGFWQYTVYFFSLSVLAYLPFVIVKGVAPRFLYSSFFFFCLVVAVTYELLKNSLSKFFKNIIFIWSVLILVISAVYTYRVVQRYKEVSDTYEKIAQTVKADFPRWPHGRDMLFYGLYNGDREVLAFITYFDKFLKRYYPDGVTGNIYRVQDLIPQKLEAVLKQDTVIYRLNKFGEAPSRIR